MKDTRFDKMLVPEIELIGKEEVTFTVFDNNNTMWSINCLPSWLKIGNPSINSKT